MTARSAPARHWRSYGNDTLPLPAQALNEPFSAFPSWFLRIECDRCGKDRMPNEAHTPQRDIARHADPRPPREDAARRCGGKVGTVKLMTGVAFRRTTHA
jgi:hypothetical protein